MPIRFKAEKPTISVCNLPKRYRLERCHQEERCRTRFNCRPWPFAPWEAEMRALLVLGGTLCGLYLLCMAAAAHLPDMRVSINMGGGFIAPKITIQIGGS